MSTRTTKVFLFLCPVASRTQRGADGRPVERFRAEWVAVGTGTVMYRSALRDDTGPAKELALAYLAKRTDLVNATP